MTPDISALPQPGAESAWDGEKQFAYLARLTAAQVRVLHATYGFALARREQGALDEGCRLLAAGAVLVARFAPDIGAQLGRAVDLSRETAIPAAVSALRPGDMRLASLRGLAALAWPLHFLLPTRRQRLRLKACLLRRALGELTRAAGAGAERAQRSPRADWNVADLCADANTLRREALDVLRAVLLAGERGPAEPLALHAAT